MNEPTSDRLVTLAQAKTEFEANMIVSILANAGIEAFAFGSAYSALPLNTRFMRVPVQVRESELEAARAALKQNIEDSVDIDWDEVDVGQREDQLPLREPGRMPLAAKLAFALILTLLLVTVIVMLVTMVW